MECLPCGSRPKLNPGQKIEIQTIHIKRVTIGDICLLKSFSRAFTICWHRGKSLQLNAKS